jgi:hypothetical protein
MTTSGIFLTELQMTSIKSILSVGKTLSPVQGRTQHRKPNKTNKTKMDHENFFSLRLVPY